jgi:hypothetical protein
MFDISLNSGTSGFDISLSQAGSTAIKIKVGGTFTSKRPKIKVGGVFSEFTVKMKIGGVFTDI